MPSAATIIVLRSFAIAFAGGLAFQQLGMPIPWLLGPMFGCLAAALLGVPLKGVRKVSDAMRTILGVAVGASITPALFERLDTILASLALMPVFIVAIGLVGVPYFERICKFDRVTAYYGAMPGGLQDMLAFGEEAGGNVRQLSLLHATRVLLIVTVLPFVLSFWMGFDLTSPPGAPARDLPLHEAVLMVAIALIGWRVAKAVGLFGASILGPLILSAAASLGDVIHYRPPAEAILVAQFFIGHAVGIKYSGITLAEVRRVVVAGVGYVGLISVVSALFAAIAIGMGLVPFLEGMLAYSPGGQAEMAVLALVAGADVGLVVAHHLVRLLVVILGAPLVARGIGLRPPRPPGRAG